MYLLIILNPLINSLILLLFGNLIGIQCSILFVVFFSILNCFLICIVFYEVAICNSICFFEIFRWIDIDICFSVIGGFFDNLTVIMLIIIIFISTLVNIYSISYMSEDPHIIRFLSYISLFTFFMILLVTSDNLLQLFIGWEGVGLCSYLLINFWFTRLQANKAAIKAMLVNRVGDIGLLLAIIFFLYLFKSVNFNIIFTLTPLFINFKIPIGPFDLNYLNLIGFCLVIGAMGKSAQIGLHTWLPDAMEGPTPVSALIHAATMVTAGVFLIIRFSPFFEYTPIILYFISIIGGITALFGATTAMFQNDIKKIIAYSTCSQLGYMFVICGISQYNLGLFHLFNHAFFKALLFLGAGSVIHSMNDEQDIRKLGGLRKILPFTYSCMVIGSFSLMGLPFLTGYYSKDNILELLYAKYTVSSHFLYYICLLSAFFTAIYSIRLLYLVFLCETNSYKQVIYKAHEVPLLMFIPLIILSFCSITFGYFFKEMFIGLGNTFWGNSIFILPNNYLAIEGEFLPIHIKLLPLIVVTSGALFSYYFNIYLSKNLVFIDNISIKIYTFFNKKWFFDKIINEFLIVKLIDFSFIYFYINIDKGLLEIFGPKGIRNYINFISKFLTKLHSLYFINYLYIFIISIFTLFLIFLQVDILTIFSFSIIIVQSNLLINLPLK